MTLPLTRPATPDDLFVWVLHRFAEVFEQHAVLKGGIALRLLDCPSSGSAMENCVPVIARTTRRASMPSARRYSPCARHE